jgi:hypothetical protein
MLTPKFGRGFARSLPNIAASLAQVETAYDYSHRLPRCNSLFPKHAFVLKIHPLIAVVLVALTTGAISACGGGSNSAAATSLSNQTISFANAGPIYSLVGTSVSNTASGGGGTGTISYSSSATAVATVDSASGKVTVVSTGTTQITATKAADAAYSSAVASYTLNASSPTGATVATGLGWVTVAWPAVSGAASYNLTGLYRLV